MGWMSWELFRCNVDCSEDPTSCISEAMYKAQVDALADGGYVAAGYTGIHMDDCWENKNPSRDPDTGNLIPNATRFPSGLKALGDYMHGKGATFGLYTAESPHTCGGYPASANNEEKDAKQFAEWGVDYIKVDGCGDKSYYENGYAAMGAALEASGRDIVYSCSWPAYIGNNESEKPFSTFINDGCNLWRNWRDIQCEWDSLDGIINHWGDYGSVLAPYAGPGHWHDMDMLLIGANCITVEEERTQMAIWSISAAPLIMGNDLRNVSDASKNVLLNKDAIAVNQDPLGQMGVRVSANASDAQQIWARNLANDNVAVGLYNKGGSWTPPPIPSGEQCPPLDKWTFEGRGYLEACGGPDGDLGSFSDMTVEEAGAKCRASDECAGFSYKKRDKSGYFKKNANCGLVRNGVYEGYVKPSQVPPATGSTADIEVKFADVGLYGPVRVYDIWAGEDRGVFNGSYTAKGVAFHDTAFLRLSRAKTPAPKPAVATQDCQNGVVAGSIRFTEQGDEKDLFVYQAGGTGSGGIDLSTPGQMRVSHGARGYFADKCEESFSPDVFHRVNVVGKTVSFKTDLSAVGCGCNAAFYMSSMPGYTSDQQPDPSEAGDYYCDANKVGGNFCPEMDLMEANAHAFQVTPHKCDQPQGKYYDNCDRGGSGQKMADPSQYGPGASKIDTNKPFYVNITFGTDASGNLNRVTTVFSQDEQITVDNQDASYLAQAGAQFKDGMTFIFSSWGDTGQTMQWLDVPPCDIGTSCNNGVAVWSDFRIESNP